MRAGRDRERDRLVLVACGVEYRRDRDRRRSLAGGDCDGSGKRDVVRPRDLVVFAVDVVFDTPE